MLALILNELIRKDYVDLDGDIRRWKTRAIFVCEVTDILLEITIVVFFSYINFDYEYDSHRSDTDFNALAEEPEDRWTTSYTMFLIFTILSIVVDALEIGLTFNTLKERSTDRSS